MRLSYIIKRFVLYCIVVSKNIYYIHLTAFFPGKPG